MPRKPRRSKEQIEALNYARSCRIYGSRKKAKEQKEFDDDSLSEAV
jgi:hypothetical protein